MTIDRALLRAKSIGVRNFRNRLSSLMRKHEIFIVTEHGAPTSVLVPYDELLEIADVFDELKDAGTIKAVAEGRKAIRQGAKGVSVSALFKRKS